MSWEIDACDVQRAIIHTRIAGKARPRTNMQTGTVYVDYDVKRSEAEIREQFLAQCRGAKDFDGPVKLEVAAYKTLPVSASRRLIGSPNTKKPDNDNITKLVQDALNHVAWLDDAQVFDSRLIKMPYLAHEESERLEVVITYYKVVERR